MRETQFPTSITVQHVAPCGIDCALCIAHLREKHPCPGCNFSGLDQPKHCSHCRIKNCAELAGSEQNYCFACSRFPCARLKNLDRRYRAKYNLSIVQNLEAVRALGPQVYIDWERERWQCQACGGVLCIHAETCIYCGGPKPGNLRNF